MDNIDLEIATPLGDFPYEKRYPKEMTIKELKLKMELIVGAAADDIRITLLDEDGRVKAEMTDDKKTLKDYDVKSGMRLFCVDATGENLKIHDDSMVEKYEMSEDAYEQREDSVRAWKKKLMAEKGAVQDNKPDPNVEAAKGIKVGDRCEVSIKGQMTRRGLVAYVGETKFKAGPWVGIQYDEPVGKNDGTVEGVRYFECHPNYGGFARPVNVTVGDYPEMEIDEM